MKKVYKELAKSLIKDAREAITEMDIDTLETALKGAKKMVKIIKKEIKKRELEADEFFNRELMGGYENE